MRYARQILIPDFGEEGQERIVAAKAVVIGSGGLGSPVLYYLAAAGVGEITIIDDDAADMTNLNRQVLHWERDLGRMKAESAKEKLSSFNSGITYHTHTERVTEENAHMLLSGHDVIVDCVDNVHTRMTVNRTGMLLDIPVVEAGINAYTGFQMNIRRGDACLGCFWGNPAEPSGPVPVLGAVAGVIGSLQALQAVKIILGQDEGLYSKVWLSDLEAMSLDTLSVERDPDCPICKGLY